MILAHLAWPDVAALDREKSVVLVPTGSLEQHGRHLPLFTDTLLVTSVASAVEARHPETVLLTPTLWLGASSHHLGFAGSLSASFEGYERALMDVVGSMVHHGFRKFLVLNGHGGNTSSNDIAARKLKDAHPNLLIATGDYFAPAGATIAQVLEGPLKGIRHACEAETSLMLRLHPDLVNAEAWRDDGLAGGVPGTVFGFDEITEEGSYGYATLATAEKGGHIFQAAVDGVSEWVEALAEGPTLTGLPPAGA